MYKVDVLELDNSFKVIKTEEKSFYFVEKANKLSNWVREDILKIKEREIKPHLTSALKVSNSSHQKDVCEGYLGSFIGLSNSVEENSSGVIIGSSTMTRGNAKVSISIIPKNLFKIISAFSARKLVIKTWKNNKDEYVKPNIENPNFEVFKNDSLIYSIFNIKPRKLGKVDRVTYSCPDYWKYDKEDDVKKKENRRIDRYILKIKKFQKQAHNKVPFV